MKRKMKTMRLEKIIVVAAIVLVVFGACSEYLNVEDATKVDPNTFPADEEEFFQLFVGAYSGLSTGNYNGPWPGGMYNGNQLLLGYLSDEVHRTDNSDPDGGYSGNISSLRYTAENDAFARLYKGLYTGVFRANMVINKAPSVDFTNVSERDVMVAEAKFLRALNYFNLTLLWGDVPMLLEEDVDNPNKLANNPPISAEEVYAQIVSDLEDAIAVLPTSQEMEGRVDVWGAKAILAKVYLFGADELGKSEWYALAETEAKEVLDGSPYGMNTGITSLYDNYQQMFDLANHSQQEYIFAVNHYHTNGATGWGDNDYGSTYDLIVLPWLNPAPTGGNGDRTGWGWQHVYQSVLEEWSDADPRKDYNLFIDGEVLSADVTYRSTSGHQADRSAREGGGSVQKFWQTLPVGKPVFVPRDWPVIRVADLMLIHAEADLMADGNLSAAGLANINAVRTRAELSPLGSADREDILQERRWELFMEGHRWFDLMRTKTAETAFDQIAALDPEGEDFDKLDFNPQRHYKLPYPYSALVANQGLTQKTGW
ncbi:MAG: hypothetical protein CMP48_03945 [Rickettsiales bacterium]|nr:hypothetical protein [Rickettsiales bacterium]